MRRFLVLAACVLLLSGCVWTRLLSLKGQFKEFDRYITVTQNGNVVLFNFKEPCFRPQDFGYLLGDEIPTERSGPDAGGTSVWTYRLRRDRADSAGLELTMRSNGELATALQVPPEVLSVIPADRVIAMARAFGSAEIDREKRTAAAGLTGDAAKAMTPGRKAIVAAFGEPDATTPQDDGASRLTYVFYLLKPDRSLGPVSKLMFDLKGEQLTVVRLEAPRFSTWVKFGDG